MNPDTPNVASISLLDWRHGSLLARWSSYGREPGQLLWGHDIAVGPDGSVYTAEVRDGDRVQKFSRR